MKEISNAFALYLLFITALSANIFAQKSAQKLTADEVKESAEIAAFVDSFVQEYYKTYDLTKVSESFFVSGYKKLNIQPVFMTSFDSYLSDEENFQYRFMTLDLINLGFFYKFDEANYNLKKVFHLNDEDKPTDDELFETKITALFQKYPKSMIFLREDLLRIKNIDDLRDSIKDFRNALQELRTFIITNQAKKKGKVSKFLTKDLKRFFELKESFNCSGDDCENFPENTKMFFYRAFLFDLLIVKNEGTLKIVRIYPLAD